MFESSEFTKFSILENYDSWINNAVSSANSLGIVFRETGRSLINSKNKSGPNIDPCDTPYVTGSNFVLKLFIDTNCFLFYKYECNSLLVPRMP